MLRDNNPNRRHNNEAGVTMDLLSVTRMQMKAFAHHKIRKNLVMNVTVFWDSAP
jgi:hypothetical protein